MLIYFVTTNDKLLASSKETTVQYKLKTLRDISG